MVMFPPSIKAVDCALRNAFIKDNIFKLIVIMNFVSIFKPI